MQSFQILLLLCLFCVSVLTDAANTTVQGCAKLSDCQDVDTYLFCHLGLSQCMPLKPEGFACHFDYECFEGYSCKDNMCYTYHKVREVCFIILMVLMGVMGILSIVEGVSKLRKANEQSTLIAPHPAQPIEMLS